MQKKRNRRLLFGVSFVLAASFVTGIFIAFGQEKDSAEAVPGEALPLLDVDYTPSLPQIPSALPEVSNESVIFLHDEHTGAERALTIDPVLQSHMDRFIKQSGEPIATVVIAEVSTGKILAMSQGRHPSLWGGNSHTALHAGFPAASLFKTTVALAGAEIANLKPGFMQAFSGSCQEVAKNGSWLVDKLYGNIRVMTLQEAYGDSCNTFFAKLAVNVVGYNAIREYLGKLGWNGRVGTDFALRQSPKLLPSIEDSATDTVGRFAAGFGDVGLSAIHEAWINLSIANDGKALPVILFQDSIKNQIIESNPALHPTLFSKQTAQTMRALMTATVRGGTARSAFRKPRYHEFYSETGGKTGTLNVRLPQGVGNWFAGMTPIEKPEVVVVAFVLLEGRWVLRASALAAEAFWAYENLHKGKRENTLASRPSLVDAEHMLILR